MPMKVHEIHPFLVHTPMVLLPTSSLVDLVATARRDATLNEVGQKLWMFGAMGGVLTVLAGLAASQEVRPSPKAREMMFRHGIGNLAVVGSIMALAAWRSRHRASVMTGVLGLAATAYARYTIYLGGEMVYGHGVGAKAIPGSVESPDVLSARAPATFLRDAVAGASWLLSTAWSRLFRKEAAPQPPAVQPPLHRVEPQHGGNAMSNGKLVEPVRPSASV
jgi:uncharacterized membrane protein